MRKRFANCPKTKRKYLKTLVGQWDFVLLSVGVLAGALALVLWISDLPREVATPILAFFLFLAVIQAIQNVDARLAHQKEQELKRLAGVLAVSLSCGGQPGKPFPDVLYDALGKDISVEVFNSYSIWDFDELRAEIVSDVGSTL
jgi:hypothetical protein